MPTFTREPLNTTFLRDIASRRAADFVSLSGCNITLRECIYYLLCCIDKTHESNVGSVVVCWRETSTAKEFGINTRRYSGCSNFLSADIDSRQLEKMRRLVEEGVPKCFVGRSLFGMPKILRHIARTGLDACDLDQINSHFSAQLARHPSATQLKRYVETRTDILTDVATCVLPQDWWPSGWTNEGALVWDTAVRFPLGVANTASQSIACQVSL